MFKLEHSRRDGPVCCSWWPVGRCPRWSGRTCLGTCRGRSAEPASSCRRRPLRTQPHGSRCSAPAWRRRWLDTSDDDAVSVRFGPVSDDRRTCFDADTADWRRRFFVHCTTRRHNNNDNKSVHSSQQPTYADNVPLPAFARRCRSNRSISHARAAPQQLIPLLQVRAHSSKPAAAGLLVWTHAGTDGRTPCRFINPAPHTTRAVPIITTIYSTPKAACKPHNTRWSTIKYSLRITSHSAVVPEHFDLWTLSCQNVIRVEHDHSRGSSTKWLCWHSKSAAPRRRRICDS